VKALFGLRLARHLRGCFHLLGYLGLCFRGDAHEGLRVLAASSGDCTKRAMRAALAGETANSSRRSPLRHL